MRAQLEQTITARTAPRPLACRALFRSLPLVLALSMAPPLATLEAQTVVRAGSRSVSMNATARLVIGVRLHAEQVGSAVRGTRSQGFTEVAVPVEAAANLAWRLAVMAPRNTADGRIGASAPQAVGERRGAILVLDEQGAWVPLPEAGAAEVAVASGEPTNPTPRLLRFRVGDAADIAIVERLRLVMQPAVGAP